MINDYSNWENCYGENKIINVIWCGIVKLPDLMPGALEINTFIFKIALAEYI